MKVLIISPRFPWPAYSGDRLRATIWLDALAPHADVSMVAPSGIMPDDRPHFRMYAARRSMTVFFKRIPPLIAGRLPFQCILPAPYDWSSAIERARQEAGPFDVTIVLLSRLHPWVRQSLQGRTLLDAIDSLRRNAQERLRAARPWTRWLWRMEERRMADVERDAARTYERILLVNEEEAAAAQAVAVSNGVSIGPLNDAPRPFDLGFWGRFPYFANADAVAWLLDEIWPAIRELEPAAKLAIGGALAPRWLRRAASRDGVTLISPVDVMSSFARSIRVALMPLRYGSGESTKALEAAEAGCAVVGTPLALRGLPALLPYSVIESTASGLARAAVSLLDETRRAPLAMNLRKAVATHYARPATLQQLRAIAEGRG